MIFNKKTKARNYTLETINKNIYIFGIAMNAEEKKEAKVHYFVENKPKYIISQKRKENLAKKANENTRK